MESLYNISRIYGEERKNLGFDYRNRLAEKTISPHILRNTLLKNFLNFVDSYFTNLISAVKWIHIHRVYTVDKNYQHIN